MARAGQIAPKLQAESWRLSRTADAVAAQRSLIRQHALAGQRGFILEPDLDRLTAPLQLPGCGYEGRESF